jgi:hypothetical protein
MARKEMHGCCCERGGFVEAGPRIPEKDAATFDKLLQASRQSSSKNESVAQLQARIKTLGEGAVKLAKTVAVLMA